MWLFDRKCIKDKYEQHDYNIFFTNHQYNNYIIYSCNVFFLISFVSIALPHVLD
jgi:hypothetical protein